jgi:hypothetical protein
MEITACLSYRQASEQKKRQVVVLLLPGMHSENRADKTKKRFDLITDFTVLD